MFACFFFHGYGDPRDLHGRTNPCPTRRAPALGRRVFRSAALSRVHRGRLIAGGFLQPIVRGWVMSSDPAADPGDTTPWFSPFWEFCAAYCDERFGDDWHLSADQSLMLQDRKSVA